MGAMLRFKSETGKEVTAIDGGFSDMCTYLWCCVVSASKHDGLDFDLSLMDFADSILPEDMAAWTESLAEDASDDNGEGEGKKKE